jgi:hypothetical protein
LEQALIGIANIFCLDKIQFKIVNYNAMSLSRRLRKNCKSKYNFNVNWARFLPFGLLSQLKLHPNNFNVASDAYMTEAPIAK